jgi:hypothetical protein
MIPISSHEICIGWIFINRYINLSNILNNLLQNKKNKEIGLLIQEIISKEQKEIYSLYFLKSLTILLFSIIKKKIIILKDMNKWIMNLQVFIPILQFKINQN